MPTPRDGPYAGLCVGGPYASKRISHPSDLYALAKPAAMPPVYPENDLVPPDFRYGHYQFDRQSGIWWWRGAN